MNVLVVAEGAVCGDGAVFPEHVERLIEPGVEVRAGGVLEDASGRCPVTPHGAATPGRAPPRKGSAPVLLAHGHTHSLFEIMHIWRLEEVFILWARVSRDSGRA
jgi:hypothetical protein